MRSLQRLLGSPSALSVLRNAIESSNLCQSCGAYETAQPRITKRPQSSRASTPSTQEREPVDVGTARDGKTFGVTNYNFGKLGHRPEQEDSCVFASADRSAKLRIRRVLDEDIRIGRKWERRKKAMGDDVRLLSVGSLQLQKIVGSHKTDHGVNDKSSKFAQPTNDFLTPHDHHLVSSINTPPKKPLRSENGEVEVDMSNREMLSIANKYRAQRQQGYSRQESLERPEVPDMISHEASQKIGRGQKHREEQNRQPSPPPDEKQPSGCYVDEFSAPKANNSNTDAAIVRYHAGILRSPVYRQLHLNQIVSHDGLDIETDPYKVAWEESSSTQYTEADVDFASLNECISVDPESALTRHAPGFHWKDMLKTQSQYEYESSVDLPASHGPRLIEYDKYASDSGLWLELVVYRRGHFGIKGLKALWEAIQSRNVEIPTEGPNADYLWNNFILMGLRHGMLSSVVDYAIRLQHKTKSHWRDLYSNIIRFKISTNQVRTYEWHSKLYERFPPSAGQFMLLFDLVHKQGGKSASTMLKLQRIYKDLPFSTLYEDIMTRLYKNEDFEAAASWHNILIMKKDMPADVSLYSPLFRYMVLYGDRKVLGNMVNRMNEADIPLPTFVKRPLPVIPASQEVIDQRLAEVHGIKPNTAGDEFCARFIATAWLSINAVIKLLCMLGVDTLGSSSLRELVVRADSDPKAVIASISQLEAAGMALEQTTYCSLVKRLAVEGNNRLLESIIQCDLHPETFDDKALQERLLEDYYRKDDQLQIDRTLAILTANSMGTPSEARVIWNVHLRLQLKQKDIKAVNRTLELMYASRIIVEQESSSCVASLYTHREPSKQPQFIHDVHTITNIWQNILRSGGVVPAIAWPEILRRLGMKGQLDEFEKLALWLAKYYSGSPDGPSLGMLPASRHMSKRLMRRLINAPSHLDPAQSSHPLSILFPPKAQQAIVAWGFQHSRPGYKDWRWGLQLLLKLKLFRVHILRSTVAEACKLRLRALFTAGQSNRLINRRARAQNAHLLKYYIQEMERIGGEALLFGDRQSSLAQRVKWMERDIKRTPWKSQTALRSLAQRRKVLRAGKRLRNNAAKRETGLRRGGPRRRPLLG
ncbi:MAG: hypothetical protein Q9195_003683 [Heterodermia aff. obscurata]